MKLSDMFPSRYVRGVDLQGQSVTVTIEKIQLEKMRPNPKSPEIKKYVLYTVEGKKGIVLLKVLASQIAHALGSEETDDWKEKKITLYHESMIVADVKRVAIGARIVSKGELKTVLGAGI